MLALAGILALFFSPLVVIAQIDVETEYGTVRGHSVILNYPDQSTKVVNSFLGIPFATAPVGDLRFAPPVKAEPYENGLFVADTLGYVCVQDPLGLLLLTHPLWLRYSEDCLNINVYTPPDINGGPYAVMVWFHGGGYTGGGNIQYPGHFLAAMDTVVVVPNYRLGAFGFLNTPDDHVVGNAGMFDQVMALEWVQDNIANFGGNRARVTIFGQSAGASSAALHMVSPLSQGLFYQAIQESGADNNVWVLNFPGQEPENYVYQVADNAGCPSDNTEDMIACLRELSQRDMRLADSISCTPGFFCQGYAPIVDGPGGFMPDIPFTLRQNLAEKSHPFIGGHCKDDGALYTAFFIPESNDGGFNRSAFLYHLEKDLVAIFGSRFEQTVFEDVLEAMSFYYTPWPFIDDEEANRQAFNKLLTDAAFGYPWDRQAKINSEHAATYTYIQAFRSLNASSFIPEWMGVPHNGELPYVWGYGYLPINPDVRADSEINFDIVGWTPEDMPYALYVQTLWTNFAKFGNPTPGPVQAPFNNTMTTWPAYHKDTNYRVLYLDGEISIKELYRQQDYAFFTEYMSYVTDEPILRKQTSGETNGSRKNFRLKSETFQQARSKVAVDALKKQFPGKFDEHLAKLKNMF